MEPGLVPDHYECLGVSHQAPPEVIRAAYLALAKLHHPDGPTPDEERMKQVNQAWNVLRVPADRVAYDAERAEHARQAAAARDARDSWSPGSPSAEQSPWDTGRAEGPPADPAWSSGDHTWAGRHAAGSAGGVRGDGGADPTLGRVGWGETNLGRHGWGETASDRSGHEETVFEPNGWGETASDPGGYDETAFQPNGWGETVDDDPWASGPAVAAAYPDARFDDRGFDGFDPYGDDEEGPWELAAHDPTAVLGRRFAAFVVDVAAVLGPALALMAFRDMPFPGAVLVAVFAFVGIHVGLQGHTGSTPGKTLFDVRTVRQSGEVPGVGRALVRSVLWVVDSFPWVLPLVGHYTAQRTAGHRRLGDLAARTFVVRRADAGYPLVTVNAEEMDEILNGSG